MPSLRPRPVRTLHVPCTNRQIFTHTNNLRVTRSVPTPNSTPYPTITIFNTQVDDPSPVPNVLLPYLIMSWGTSSGQSPHSTLAQYEPPSARLIPSRRQPPSLPLVSDSKSVRLCRFHSTNAS